MRLLCITQNAKSWHGFVVFINESVRGKRGTLEGTLYFPSTSGDILHGICGDKA